MTGPPTVTFGYARVGCPAPLSPRPRCKDRGVPDDASYSQDTPWFAPAEPLRFAVDQSRRLDLEWLTRILQSDSAELLIRSHLQPQNTKDKIYMDNWKVFWRALGFSDSDKVAALILCDTRASADTEEGKQSRHEMAALARQQGTPPIIEAMIPRLLGETTLRTKPQTAERVKEMIRAAQPEGIAQALFGMAQRDDSTELLSKITCPTLIIVGSEDKLTPPSDAEKMHQSIAFSQLRVINHAGHLANLEEPSVFNQTVRDFLKQLS